MSASRLRRVIIVASAARSAEGYITLPAAALRRQDLTSSTCRSASSAGQRGRLGLRDRSRACRTWVTVNAQSRQIHSRPDTQYLRQNLPPSRPTRPPPSGQRPTPPWSPSPPSITSAQRTTVGDRDTPSSGPVALNGQKISNTCPTDRRPFEYVDGGTGSPRRRRALRATKRRTKNEIQYFRCVWVVTV